MPCHTATAPVCQPHGCERMMSGAGGNGKWTKPIWRRCADGVAGFLTSLHFRWACQLSTGLALIHLFIVVSPCPRQPEQRAFACAIQAASRAAAAVPARQTASARRSPVSQACPAPRPAQHPPPPSRDPAPPTSSVLCSSIAAALPARQPAAPPSVLDARHSIPHTQSQRPLPALPSTLPARSSCGSKTTLLGTRTLFTQTHMKHKTMLSLVKPANHWH